jgi:hypothetical protein
MCENHLLPSDVAVSVIAASVEVIWIVVTAAEVVLAGSGVNNVTVSKMAATII